MAGEGRPGPECGIAVAYDELDADNGEVLSLVLNDRGDDEVSYTYPSTLVADALSEMLGRQVGKEVVKHHRRRDCRCD